MITLLIATHNRHKVLEIQAILGSEFRCLTLDEFHSAPEVIEDAGTFAGNATKKAVQLAKWLSRTLVEGTMVLADDSGLEVDALNGAPGVNSARFAALDTGQSGNSSTAANNTKLLRLLKEVPLEKRSARFKCVLALTHVLQPSAESASPACSADEFEIQTQVFDGTCEGRIVFEARGTSGFGYDPLFLPEGYERTFGELSEETKNRLSHRAKALEKLRRRLLR
jgi:XTP/dITP diphosphohydrolase